MKESFFWESLEKAVKKLPSELRLDSDSHYTFTESKNWGFDGQIQLGSGPTCFIAYKEKLSTPVVEKVILTSQETNIPVLLYSPYVSPVYADRLREKGVWFMDEVGNAHLAWEGFFLFISRVIPKKNRPYSNEQRPKREFTVSALKVLYALLVDKASREEALLNQPYRRIHEKTSVSLGAIGGIIASLEAQGFLIERGSRDRVLVQKENLITRWAEGYARKLRPKLVKEHYRLPYPAWAESLRNVEAPGQWGGEVAGAHLTSYLVPETVTIYTPKLSSEFIIKHDLRKDPAGRLEVLRPFWPEKEGLWDHGCVHPLIVYADLMATEIDRNLETAQRVYEKYLRPMAEAH